MDLFEVRAECDGFVLRDGEAGAHEQHFEARDLEGRQVQDAELATVPRVRLLLFTLKSNVIR